MGAVLRFPTAPGASRLPASVVEVHSLDPQGAARLLGIVRQVMGRAQVLIEDLDGNRRQARMAGVETVIVELSAILEGGRLQDIESALEEASRGSGRPEISMDGFSKLRRAERLVQEADENMAHFRGGMVPYGHAHGMGCSNCGGGLSLGNINVSVPLPTLLIGIVGMGALLAGLYLIMSRRK